MNAMNFLTKRKCWIFDFLILIIELMISCLPKRLRLIFESNNRFPLISHNHEILGVQSSDFK